MGSGLPRKGIRGPLVLGRAEKSCSMASGPVSEVLAFLSWMVTRGGGGMETV